jgi:hypothetical protein
VPCRIGEWSELQKLQVLVGDNPERGKAPEYDDRRLGAILSELSQGNALGGAGYDAAALDALISGLTEEVPGFAPAGEEEQGRLDHRVEIECPECGHRFAPTAAARLV